MMEANYKFARDKAKQILGVPEGTFLGVPEGTFLKN
jgi:hypothetical protein